jgi:hypothetical protein
MKRLFVTLLGAVMLVALVVTPATASSVFASYDSSGGTIWVSGGTVASAVAADDADFVQLDNGAYVKFAFPAGWDAVPDGTSAPDLTVYVVDDLYAANGYVDLTLALDGTVVQAGLFPDTADVQIDLDALGTGPVHFVKVTQGPLQDPAYPHLGFDLNAVSASQIGPRHVTGTWSQYPTAGSEFRANILQPINASGTSNWSIKSKGGIPVQWSVEERTTAAEFHSTARWPDPNYASWVTFSPDAMTLADIGKLSTTYDFTTGDCGGGSLRWEIGLSTGKAIFVYYGALPNFTDCTTANQSGVNMVTLSDARVDTSQIDNVFYNTWQNALTLAGGTSVDYIALVIDSFWSVGNQVLTVSDTTVNDQSYDFQTGSASDWSAVCPTEPAYIGVAKMNGAVEGTLNEDVAPAYATDDGHQYRIVDCKYQYVLSIPSFRDGIGTYRVDIQVPDDSRIGFADFDLK